MTTHADTAVPVIPPHPNKWEYPWYAAWDLAFHILGLTLVDPEFGKQQLRLMLRERYMNPNGQLPAYEWNFGDVNPPVHAWSTIFTYGLDRARTGEGDREWLKGSFQELLLNFTWWVNRKDRTGRNVFEGGFLGLDNIAVFDRSSPPHWRDHILFYEYFHGDNGAGLGASHQTGWTAVIARTMHLFATMSPEQILQGGKRGYFEAQAPTRSVSSASSATPSTQGTTATPV